LYIYLCLLTPLLKQSTENTEKTIISVDYSYVIYVDAVNLRL